MLGAPPTWQVTYNKMPRIAKSIHKLFRRGKSREHHSLASQFSNCLHYSLSNFCCFHFVITFFPSLKTEDQTLRLKSACSKFITSMFDPPKTNGFLEPENFPLGKGETSTQTTHFVGSISRFSSRPVTTFKLRRQLPPWRPSSLEKKKHGIFRKMAWLSWDFLMGKNDHDDMICLVIYIYIYIYIYPYNIHIQVKDLSKTPSTLWVSIKSLRHPMFFQSFLPTTSALPQSWWAPFS